MLSFEKQFDPAYGRAVAVADGILRVTARNPGPFTFRGTNSYVIGGANGCFVVDPGPDEPEHAVALAAAIGGRPVDAILLTHTHRDHTGSVGRLQAETFAPVIGGGPHRPARPMLADEAGRMEASADMSIAFDRVLDDDEPLTLGGVAVTAIATPGHAANHLAFAIGTDGVLLSGDHVMAWSTTVVAPPDGSMRDYMRSLYRLLARDERVYLPGHGGVVESPAAFVRGLIDHRHGREAAIMARLAAGDRHITQIVAALYRDVDPRLHPAAGLSVLAHLEDLVARGMAATPGLASLTSAYTPT
ncbi:MBL fold metallo-hydrolase [Aurantimonas aggregata]|uniref:MBL fold metallo-hydrolase n=1 Tax=Aurantimonas aggregata TaxID=2047720 RepID=A0A6L9MDN6_9HYPH|nr:MBL fold metallo-hydrolase [Aurantimonas aggregata]NDV85939.1 MBL fold metallo-hydrolase [Aurantimonas aggregata]